MQPLRLYSDISFSLFFFSPLFPLLFLTPLRSLLFCASLVYRPVRSSALSCESCLPDDVLNKPSFTFVSSLFVRPLEVSVYGGIEDDDGDDVLVLGGN
jgi:hypothetical protein